MSAIIERIVVDQGTNREPRKGRPVRVLVAVASRHGAIAEIAAEICMNLRHATPRGAIQADLVAAEEPPALDGYDAMIIGSASAGGRWLSAMVRQHEKALPLLPLWLFSTWSAVREPSTREENYAVIGDSVAAGTDAIEHQMFGAKIDRDGLSQSEHLAADDGFPEADFRDWAAVRAWVSQIVERLSPTPAPQVG